MEMKNYKTYFGRRDLSYNNPYC